MAILITIGVIFGALFLANLILTFGTIRRLRERTAILGGHSDSERSVIGLPIGETPAVFEAVTLDGQRLTGPAGFRLVAFFSSSCSICAERVPTFTDYARVNHLGRDRVLAVVLGSTEESLPHLDELAAVAQVCAEPENDELSKAFAVSGYPAFCLLDADGAVGAASFDPAALPVPIAA